MKLIILHAAIQKCHIKIINLLSFGIVTTPLSCWGAHALDAYTFGSNPKLLRQSMDASVASSAFVSSPTLPSLITCMHLRMNFTNNNCGGICEE